MAVSVPAAAARVCVYGINFQPVLCGCQFMSSANSADIELQLHLNFVGNVRATHLLFIIYLLPPVKLSHSQMVFAAYTCPYQLPLVLSELLAVDVIMYHTAFLRSFRDLSL